ncbi:DNA-binding protein [Xanthomonas axonopodis pv. melhusii]|uniref:DNA-binding protein n=1 Tax=Xanthomonas axonopodis pv. melhusii TaxID=487834 RepID=A0A1T1NZ98_9XANT|nr:DNA-binding protein [Xanthomonas axonopodis]OOW68674.1 DNA-binding protein [Xanthomonas axonopodis pv. melhusii]
MANRIPLDPKLPKLFDSTPNEQRSKAQLDAWWDHPFGVTMADGRIDVRCLNGGAWDRSTHLGVADDYNAACILAEAKQAAWLRFRERPVGSPQDGKFLLLKMPQRPDEDMVTVGTFDTAEAANEYLREHYPETPR